MRALLPACCLGLALWFTGCATTSKPQLNLTGDILKDGPNAVQNGPPRDRVLWQYRTAAAAMDAGDFDLARQMLDDALRKLQGLYGTDADARKARSYFSAEERKTYVGEPYERSMAYIYRGILYWKQGQMDNARACFRSAEFEDSDTEEKKYAGDWVLPDYLDGFTTAKLGGDGADAFKRAQASAKGITLPEYDTKANALFFLAYDQGPVKFSAGQYGEQLKFKPGTSTIRSAELVINSATYPVAPTDNVSFQASTRGGRVMDHILGKKAVFKSTTSTVGDVAIISGAILATQQGHHGAADEVGLGLLLAGVASKLISAATIPRADIRTWDNLPQSLSFAKLILPPGPHTATIHFLDHAGRRLENLTRTVSFEVPADGRDAVIFISDKSKTPQNQ